MINFGVRRSTVKVTGGLSYIRGLVEASFSTPWVEYLFMPPQAMLHRRHFCLVRPVMRRGFCPSRSVPNIFISLRKNIERMSMKFVEAITTTNRLNDYVFGKISVTFMSEVKSEY